MISEGLSPLPSSQALEMLQSLYELPGDSTVPNTSV